MKSNKFFLILSFGVILALLVTIMPTSPVLAYDYDIELDPEEGEIGDVIEITGDDWPPSNYSDEPYVYREVDIYFTSEEADEGDEIDSDIDNYELVKSSYDVDEDGDWDTSFRVPSVLADGDDDEDVVSGTYYVCVTMADDDEIEAVAEFVVIAAEITLDDDKGTVGTLVEISGLDFNDNEDIIVEYDDYEIDIESGDEDTDSDGEFTCKILIPESTAGEHTIKVTDDTGASAEATFTVEPEITLDPTSGAPGDRIAIVGTGFGDQEEVTIEIDSTDVGVRDTNDEGSFSFTMEVPVLSSGSYTVTAEDDDNNKAEADFTISANVRLSVTTGSVGDEITISGSGFRPSTTITITYATTPETVATTTSDSNGAFTATFEVPASEGGAHTVTATDGTNTLTATFTMESTPPAIPAPSLPLDGEKPERPIVFDWDDVTDDSAPVTYTLQIATDQAFTAPLVLEKTGLTTSTYTMAEAENKGLQSTKEGAPYYWRVRAVDAASNKSGWSGIGSFYVGFALDIGDWGKYLLWALGGLLLFFIGFFLGRRSGYAY